MYKQALLLLALAGPVAAQGFDPPVAVDLDPDPNVVEINLRASVTTWQYKAGVDTTVWAYNDSVPGPTIVAEVGNLLKVHFTNDLPEDTTIHWHGVELPAKQDGSHIAQVTIPAGTTYDYQFTLLSDGLFWYHPHVRPFDQVEKGLYGALLVRDPVKDQALGFDQIEEHIVVFDDVLLDANDQVVPAFSFTDPLQNVLYQLNGRVGNVLLVNGREAGTVTLNVTNGQPQRWRVLNAANTTFGRLDINDSAVGMTSQLWLVGVDGGYLEQRQARPPVSIPPPDHPILLGEEPEGIFVVPGERMDVIFTPVGSDGQRFTIKQTDWFRGRHAAVYGSGGQIMLPDDPMDGRYPPQDYFDLVVQGPDPGGPYYEPPLNLIPITITGGDPVGTLPVTFGHSSPDPAGNVTFFAQADFSTGSMVPLPTPKIDSFNAYDVTAGETWIWEITNLSHGDHPFHTHGFFFMPLTVEFFDSVNPINNGTFTFKYRQKKDTLRVWARTGAKGTSNTKTRVRMHFDPTGRDVVAMGQEATYDPTGDWTSGGWLFHCHILEHSGRGMLSFYEVHDPAEKFTLLGKHLPGTNGNPYLTARGDLSAGSAVLADVTNALPNWPIGLVGGTDVFGSPINIPFKGGTLVPFPEAILLGVTDANGNATFTITGWDTAPSGTELYIQAGFPDAAGVEGWALTNALSWTRP